MRRLLLLLTIALLLTACSDARQWLTLLLPTPAVPTVAGNADNGAVLFRAGANTAPPCIGCHQVGDGGFGLSLGPKLQGIAARAGNRMEGYNAAAYIEDSILNPQHFVVSGFHVTMYPDYALYLSEQDVADLVAYLLTL